MKDLWPDIKSSARALLLAWLVILTPIVTVATVIETVNPDYLAND